MNPTFELLQFPNGEKREAIRRETSSGRDRSHICTCLSIFHWSISLWKFALWSHNAPHTLSLSLFLSLVNVGNRVNNGSISAII